MTRRFIGIVERRTDSHRSLDKDAPVSRLVQRTGSIRSFPILGGLHRHYARVYVFGTYSHAALAGVAPLPNTEEFVDLRDR
jgi:hypothetical protein